MPEVESLRALVHGRVQGVLFRDYVRRRAKALALLGSVRNLPDGETVEVIAEGQRDKLEELLKQLEIGPRRALVERVEYEWGEATGRYADFHIVP